MVEIFIFMVFIMIPAIPTIVILWKPPFKTKRLLQYMVIITLLTWSSLIYLSLRISRSPVADFTYTLSVFSLVIYMIGLTIKMSVIQFQKIEKRKIKISYLLKSLGVSILLFTSLFYIGSDFSYGAKDREFKQFQNIYNQKIDQLISDSSTAGFNGQSATKVPESTPADDCFFVRETNQMKYIAFHVHSNRYFFDLGYVYFPNEDAGSLSEFRKNVIGLVRLEPHWYRYTYFD